jgi:hypothetical protein
MNIENNIILNEFVGLTPKLESPDVYTFAKMPFFSCRHDTPEKVTKSIAEYTKYDQDWNLIMDVVEKIETIEDCRFDVMREQYCVIIKDSYQMIEMFEVSADTKIEALYNACVKFVKWYNKTLKKQEKFKFLFGKD